MFFSFQGQKIRKLPYKNYLRYHVWIIIPSPWSKHSLSHWFVCWIYHPGCKPASSWGVGIKLGGPHHPRYLVASGTLDYTDSYGEAFRGPTRSFPPTWWPPWKQGWLRSPRERFGNILSPPFTGDTAKGSFHRRRVLNRKGSGIWHSSHKRLSSKALFGLCENWWAFWMTMKSPS